MFQAPRNRQDTTYSRDSRDQRNCRVRFSQAISIVIRYDNKQNSMIIYIDYNVKECQFYINRHYQRMSNIKSIHTALEGVQQQNSKSSTKRLYESVFRIIDHDDISISSFEQPIANHTNGSRILAILRDGCFLSAIMQKLKKQIISFTFANMYPILKVKCINKKGLLVSLHLDDLRSVFQKFGAVYAVDEGDCDQLSYYVMFTSFCGAYVGMKLVDGFMLRHTFAQLHVRWCMSQDYTKIAHISHAYHHKIQWNQLTCDSNIPEDTELSKKQSSGSSMSSGSNGMKQCKLTCRYDIQIENEKDFQVARRIIGSKGINMKKIIESALSLEQQAQSNENSQPNSNCNQILKLRLRGRGSGYKEGPQQMQSQQQLHLCISAKDELIYNYACQSVERLLQNVYQQYQEYTKKQGRCSVLEIKRSDISIVQVGITSTNTNTNTNNQHNQVMTEISTPGGYTPANDQPLIMRDIDTNQTRMEPSNIEHYLELRNKARRQLNFAEADRIRNYLRACGVCLIDEKGRRGKAAEVTTWKYLI